MILHQYIGTLRTQRPMNIPYLHPSHMCRCVIVFMFCCCLHSQTIFVMITNSIFAWYCTRTENSPQPKTTNKQQNNTHIHSFKSRPNSLASNLYRLDKIESGLLRQGEFIRQQSHRGYNSWQLQRIHRWKIQMLQQFICTHLFLRAVEMPPFRLSSSIYCELKRTVSHLRQCGHITLFLAKWEVHRTNDANKNDGGMSRIRILRTFHFCHTSLAPNTFRREAEIKLNEIF